MIFFILCNIKKIKNKMDRMCGGGGTGAISDWHEHTNAIHGGGGGVCSTTPINYLQ